MTTTLPSPETDLRSEVRAGRAAALAAKLDEIHIELDQISDDEPGLELGLGVAYLLDAVAELQSKVGA